MNGKTKGIIPSYIFKYNNSNSFLFLSIYTRQRPLDYFLVSVYVDFGLFIAFSNRKEDNVERKSR